MTTQSPYSWLSLESLQRHPDVAAIAILVAGVLLALLLARGATLVISAAGRANVDVSKLPSSRTASRLAFWITLLLAMLLALRVMEADSFSGWRSGLIEYGSRALVGFIILVLGIGVASVVKDLLGSFSNSQETTLLARLLQYLILAFAFITAFDQMGLDVLLLLTAGITAVITVLAGALALAFALGSRDYVANLMASSELSRLSIGDRLRIDGHEGIVTEVHRLGVDLATTEGTVTVPANHLLNQPYVKLVLQDDA